jgi:hypothetical protein
VGEVEEYILRKSITEGNTSFGGRTARSPGVATAMDREGRGREKGGIKKELN